MQIDGTPESDFIPQDLLLRQHRLCGTIKHLLSRQVHTRGGQRFLQGEAFFSRLVKQPKGHRFFEKLHILRHGFRLRNGQALRCQRQKIQADAAANQ